ncbi:phosphatases II [Xylaria palmicola]|nr:phosphatases II [Xylaria palmicola]
MDPAADSDAGRLRAHPNAAKPGFILAPIRTVKTARPAAPYDWRAPSPPPLIINSTAWSTSVTAVPSYDNVDPASLTDRDLAIITQNGRVQVALDTSHHWAYESRRTAQPILDFLYLGPSAVVRNRQWLREQGITMILAARDAQQASLNMMSFDGIARDMDIESRFIDVAGEHELIHAFPSAVRMISNHMLRIYHEQAAHAGMRADDGGEAGLRRGRVLVFCETGNNRSPAVVCAYLMAVLGMSAAEAYVFVQRKRFCVSLGEDLKRDLKTYEDILLAQRTVHRHELSSSTLLSSGKATAKRGLEHDDSVDDDGDNAMKGTDQYRNLDRDRFLGRRSTPFVD